MGLQGKGFFIQNLLECEGGDADAILRVSRQAGLSHVLIKVAAGPSACHVAPDGKDTAAPVVTTLREGGIAVWGWQDIFGDIPEAEAAMAVRRVRELSLDGLVVVAGREYKHPGRVRSARRFMADVRASIDVPIALSSYRFPNYHPDFPWVSFLEHCDYHMPQVTWEAAHNPAWQLGESKRQCDALPHSRPYLATAPAYLTTDGWAPTQLDIQEFLASVREHGIEAVNFFRWESCRQDLPHIWKAVSEYPWEVPVQVRAGEPAGESEPSPVEQTGLEAESHPGVTISPVPVPEGQTPDRVPPDAFTKAYLAAIDSRSPMAIGAFYLNDAVQVRDEKMFRGQDAIQEAYLVYLMEQVPAGCLEVLRSVVEGDVRYITWRVGDKKGETTLLLHENRIAMEYTYLI